MIFFWDAKSGVTKVEAAAFADQAVASLRNAFSAGWSGIDELKEPEIEPLRGGTISRRGWRRWRPRRGRKPRKRTDRAGAASLSFARSPKGDRCSSLLPTAGARLLGLQTLSSQQLTHHAVRALTLASDGDPLGLPGRRPARPRKRTRLTDRLKLTECAQRMTASERKQFSCVGNRLSVRWLKPPRTFLLIHPGE